LRAVPGGGCQSAALGLGHELAHAYEEDLYPQWFAHQVGTPSPAYGWQVERWAITGPEASAALIKDKVDDHISAMLTDFSGVMSYNAVSRHMVSASSELFRA
jgi:hypothetical protein